MKKVIFICFLTLSVCLSQPTTADAANKTNTDAAAQKPNNTVPKDKTAEVPKTTEKDSNHTDPATLPPHVNPGNGTVAPKNETGKNETTIKPTESNTTPVTTSTHPTTTTTTTTAPTVPTNSTAPPAKPTNNTNVSSTIPPPPLQARGFDGASFVGGIILTLGLLAIGFMGFRYYKTQTERNYHTL